MSHRLIPVSICLLLPWILRGGHALALMAVRERRLAWVLAPGVALASWLLAIHVTALWAQSFYFGLYAGTPIAAGIWFTTRFIAQPVEEGPALSFWMYLGALLVVALLLGPEARFSEHDECIAAGHISFPLEMLNGIYPPRHLVYPQFELRYHYGFDLASATFAAILGQPDMWFVVHGLTLLLWGYAFCLFWVLGERWINGAFAGPVTAVSVLLAGGFPFLCRALKPLGSFLIGDCLPNGMWILPPIPSHFIQHPWSLGYPLGACALLVFQTRRRDAWWFVALTVLMAFLALTQFVFFAALLATFVAVGSLDRGRFDARSSWQFLLWGALVVAIVYPLHGFLARVNEPSQTQLEFHLFFRDHGLSDWASWMLQSFGFLLPLGVAGFFFLPVQRATMLLLIVGGLTVFNFSRHPNSWDIVKFAQLAQLALAILSAATLQRLIAAKATRVAGLVGLVSIAAYGCSWCAALAFDLPGLFFCKSLPERPPEADQKAIDFLRQHIVAGELVFRSSRPSLYAIYGGLPEPKPDWAVGSFGFGKPLEQQRSWLLARPSSSADDYLAQSFRWFVLGNEDTALNEFIETWRSQGRADLRAEFAPLRVYHLDH